MSDAMVQFSDGRVTWSPGMCSCGGGRWTIGHGRDAQEVMAATCECGERRALRLTVHAMTGVEHSVMIAGYGVGGSYEGPAGDVLVTTDTHILAHSAPPRLKAPPEPPKPVEPSAAWEKQVAPLRRWLERMYEPESESEPVDFKPLSETCEAFGRAHFKSGYVPVPSDVLGRLAGPVAMTARAFDKLAASTAPVINALDGLSRAFQALTEVRSEAEDLARASTDEQLLDYAERHPVREHRETARAEMQARWAARAALPPMLDDFDNLPDADPAGIVRRP